MELTRRERQMLVEIEKGLMRRDRALARRFGALGAVESRLGPQRFACQVSLLEIVVVLVVAVMAVILPVLVILGA
ncbi:DUF3040 domain-containing protein [Nonomuraea mangrovi]|uniref:DUF3040 domain-containing protein n=1 Tax=Nonomuraea mangrovi TaxID=2316207 RepID=A0ABW4T2M0_9ACTN